MTLETTLLNSKPREESGSTTSRKYSFQSDFSLFLLLRRHEKLEDYVYLFDLHDDLIILNYSVTPTEIHFYQIKTKDKGNWTINDFVKIDKSKNSIAGKIYSNRIKFKTNTKSLNFISNANFSFKNLKSKNDSLKMSELNAGDLSDLDLQLCENQITTELAVKNADDFKELTTFKVTKLSNKDSSTHCLGELSTLINKLNPDNKINPQLAYKQIIGEVHRKTQTITSDKTLSNLNELINIKGISKNLFIDYLEKAGLYKSVEENWLDVKSELAQLNLGTLEMLKFQKSFRDVHIKLISEVNKLPMRDLIRNIKNEIANARTSNNISDNSNLLEIISVCESKISSQIYDAYFIKCLIIKLIYEEC